MKPNAELVSSTIAIRVSISSSALSSLNVAASVPDTEKNMTSSPKKYTTFLPKKRNLPTIYAAHAVTNAETVGQIKLSVTELKNISPIGNTENISA